MRKLVRWDVLGSDLLEKARPLLADRLRAAGLADALVEVRVGVLSPEEAIGRPLRTDFPLLKGKEVIVEARLAGARGQAFTGAPCEFRGAVREVLKMDLSDARQRSVFGAVLNAVWRHGGLADRTVHCHDEEPEECARELAAEVKRLGPGRVGLVGLQPAFLDALVRAMGTDGVRTVDLDPDNVGEIRYGVRVEDAGATEEVIDWADLVLVTGSSVVNGSFTRIGGWLARRRRRFLVYGISAAAVCEIFGLPRFCHRGH